jgi:pimeloyl-ACP methyl ester carboxylesterase
MRSEWALAAAVALPFTTTAGGAQTSQATEIAFPSAGFEVRGLFFPAKYQPIATLVFLPGGDMDPTHILDLGPLPSTRGVSVVTFATRGVQGSAGRFSFAHNMDDIDAALRWLQGPGGRAFNVDPDRIAIGGHSLGGGIALAFAAHDLRTMPVVSIAGNDLGEFARRLRRDSTLAAGLHGRVAQMGADGEAVVQGTMPRPRSRAWFSRSTGPSSASPIRK